MGEVAEFDRKIGGGNSGKQHKYVMFQTHLIHSWLPGATMYGIADAIG